MDLFHGICGSKIFFNKNCVMNYNMLNTSQRKLKTDIFDKLYDQFSQLKIKRFYLKIKLIVVLQEIDKDTIIKLFKSITTAKIKQIDQENVIYDKTAITINK